MNKNQTHLLFRLFIARMLVYFIHCVTCVCLGAQKYIEHFVKAKRVMCATAPNTLCQLSHEEMRRRAGQPEYIAAVYKTEMYIK